jgi:DNA transposition AAA+ family ATPase
MSTNTQIQENQHRLDAVSLEKIAAIYPEEMRDPFLWLGSFFRDVCGRDFDVLVAKAKKLGIETDKTNWSKILRGKWNRDAENNPLPNPIISVGKFLKSVSLLRDDERVREMAGKVPFIATSTTERLHDYIDLKRAPERVNRFGVVVGHTGLQKTAAYREYCRVHNHGLCVWKEAPENGSMKEFISGLAVAYGASPNLAHDALRRKVVESVTSAKTIIVDNAQRLYKEKFGTTQPAFDFIQRLQDEKQCTIILSITPTFFGTLTEGFMKGYFEQFEGRAGGRRNFLKLPDYAPEEDVLAIARGMGLKEADKHLEYLVAISREPGRIRILFEALQAAKIESEKRRKPLTISLVKYVRDEEDGE